MGARGPEKYRANKIQLGAAYAFYDLYSSSNKYKNYYVLHERDYISENDTEIARNKRATEAEKKTGIYSKRLELYKKKHNNISSFEDINNRNRNRTMINVLNRIDEELGYRKLFPIYNNIDKEKLIHMILDTYPDPSFFLHKHLKTNEWTGALLYSVFSSRGKYHMFRRARIQAYRVLNEFEYPVDYAFSIKSGKGGIIRILDLPFSVEDYNKAIDSYIESATVESLRIRLNDKLQVFKVNIEPYYKNKATASRCVKYDKENCLFFGIYKFSIKPHKEYKHKNIALVMPRYRYYDDDYLILDADNDISNDRTIFPLTATFSDEYIFANRKNADKDKEVVYNQFYKINRLIDKKQWKGHSYKIDNSDLVILYDYYYDRSKVKRVFILKKNVVNAKLVKDFFK